MFERSRPDRPDEDPGRDFDDRAVRLETTFERAGVLSGDLTPECAAIVGAVLDALSAPDLMLIDGSSALMEEWTTQVRARWAAHRAQASESGSDGGAWLDGDAAAAIMCDAAMAPIVTGEVNPDALEDMVRLCVVQPGTLPGQPGQARHRSADRAGQDPAPADAGPCRPPRRLPG